MRKQSCSKASTLPTEQRIQIAIHGTVQGVGFRPFVYRLAHQYQLMGSISNTGTGVKIDVQGSSDKISQFQRAVIEQKPARAVIAEVVVDDMPPTTFNSFIIEPSDSHSDKALALLPDTAICQQCLEELFDPQNRRYLYPFLHCISCGPRFSLFRQMPFDRDHTSMNEFQMCQMCLDEYADPENRRFYSQTNCCPTCGPKLEPGVEHAVEALYLGKIVAIKNTGGYLLLVDATNEEAVLRLRERKQRVGKPFALLMPTLNAIEEIAEVGEIEKQVLNSAAAPIVLLKKKQTSYIAPSVAHESPYFGVMLPHNALQHLLMHHFKMPLVATSGNISGSPLCITEEEALKTLGDVADLLLNHERKITHRLDDSIVQVMGGQPVILRKARGYVPSAIEMPSSKTLFAAGSQMKNSFAFLKQGQIYQSQYMGDLESVETALAYENEVGSWERLLDIPFAEGVGDKHPDYYSTRYVMKKNISSTRIQHHQAHVWSGMADNHLSPPVFSIAWDGTGYGDDATIWGGEAFLVSNEGMKRVASLYPFMLPGGEKGVREPRRALFGLFHALQEAYQGDAFTEEERINLNMALSRKINTPLCSSIGRLFDGVSALLGCCQVSDYEGQAALLLESAAHQGAKTVHFELPLIKEKNLYLLDWRPMIRQMIERKHSVADLALAFHDSLARAIVSLAKIGNCESVLLTGGVMQNKLLVEKAILELSKAGFKPFIHRDIPPNDGGIAVGQIIGRLRRCV
ncbi:MAG: carbamoyltransferase HypF [Verrucomicrobia bacterium]|nr:carbamoyltransferase HypF [Verrucomicrobiota bacterium]